MYITFLFHHYKPGSHEFIDCMTITSCISLGKNGRITNVSYKTPGGAQYNSVQIT